METKKYKTIKEHKKALNEKYSGYLKYPIQRMRTRKWYDAGPGSGRSYEGKKYDIYYYTSIIVEGKYKVGLDVKASNLDLLEKIIINKIQGDDK